MKKCNPGYYAGTSTPIYIPLDNGKQMGWTSDGNPCSFKPTSSHDYSGIGLGQVGGDRYRISNPFNTKPDEFSVYSPLFRPQSKPYVRPEVVPYTQPSQLFVEPYVPYVAPNPSEATKKTDPVITNKQYVDKSIALRQSGDYENALKSCDAALQADPTYLDVWNEKAAVFINKGQYEKAIECCDEALKIDSKYSVAYINKAIASRILGDYENALKSCDEALKINPQYTDGQNEKNNILNGFYLKVSALITQKQYEEAIRACDIIIKSDPKNFYTYHNKALSLTKLGTYDKALECCNLAIQYMGNSHHDIERVEGLNSLYLKRLEQYKESSTKRDYLYNSSNVNGVNAFSWSKSNPTRDFNSFFKYVLKVPTNTPDNVRIINNLNKNLPLYLEEVKRADYYWDQYNKYYQDMMRLKGKLTLVACIYNTKAEALKKSGDYESALKYCDLALTINPAYLTASNFKDYILREKADFEKAVEYSDNMLRIKPSYQMSNFDYFLKLPCLSTVSTIDLRNKQIGNDGAKLLADSLAKGEMPNLKKLHLEGNQITDEGVSYYLDNLKKDQLNSTYVSFTSSKSTIDKIMEFFGKGARYYVSEYEKAQQSSKEADIAVNGKDGFGHCVQVVRTAGIDFASAMAQKAIAMPPIVKKVVEKSPVQVKLIVGGGLVISSLDEVKGAFLSEDFAYCMAWFNQEIIGDNGHENSDI